MKNQNYKSKAVAKNMYKTILSCWFEYQLNVYPFIKCLMI